MRFDRAWLPLNGLRAFEATARHASFTKAASELKVTQSAVSRQVQRLEELLGVQLLQRDGRVITLTAHGKTLFASTTDSFDSMARAMRDVVEEENQERLRISISTSFAHCFGPSLVSGFVKSHPDVRLEVDSDWIASDIEASEYDLAIVYSQDKITEHVMDLLWREEVVPLCSPSLLACQATNDVDSVMAQNPLIHIKTDAGSYHTWETWAKSQNIPATATHRGTVFNTSTLGVQCAIRGEGLVMTDKRLFQREIDEGLLVAPFDFSCHSGFGYYLIFRHDDLTNERLQAFRNWVVDYFMDDRM